MSQGVTISAEYIAKRKAELVHTRTPRQLSPPSQRTPNRHRRNNPADMIEEQMQRCGHDIWGYVIYRTTYESDSDWQDCMAQLNAHLENSFECCNGKDVLEKLTLTVMDNRELFNTASTDDIRRHFNGWVTQNYTSEQPHAKETEEDAQKRPSGSSRYRYAICIDTESLQSILAGFEYPNKEPWVKVIKRSWKPSPAEELEDEEPQEPLEAVTQHDVGWMRVCFSGLITFYEYFADRNYWNYEYVRPPRIWIN